MIEDDPAIAEMYRVQLEHDGYRVTIANTAEIGLSTMSERAPDIVLLDLLLPDRSGFEMLATLNERLPNHPPVVILSNYGEPSMIDRGRSLGAVEYLVKSRVTPLDISGQISGWIERGPVADLCDRLPALRLLRFAVPQRAHTDRTDLAGRGGGPARDLDPGRRAGRPLPDADVLPGHDVGDTRARRRLGGPHGRAHRPSLAGQQPTSGGPTGAPSFSQRRLCRPDRHPLRRGVRRQRPAEPDRDPDHPAVRAGGRACDLRQLRAARAAAPDLAHERREPGARGDAGPADLQPYPPGARRARRLLGRSPHGRNRGLCGRCQRTGACGLRHRTGGRGSADGEPPAESIITAPLHLGEGQGMLA